VLDGFRSSGLVLLSGDPAVTGHVQERVRELAPAALASARAQASIVLADGATLLGRLPPSALGHLPLAGLLAEAQRDAVEGEALAATDPAAAMAKLDRAYAVAGQCERLTWERGVLALGSMVAGPLATSDATLAEHWQFIEALTTIQPQENILPGGGMERIEDLAGNGWRHFAVRQPELRTLVDMSRDEPASGAASLRIRAEAVNPAEAPLVLETPPVWITTPPISPPSGKLLQIEARVWVPGPVKGSVDGLLVFDSIGGPSLAERVGVTPGWRRLVLYRVVPGDASGEPFTITFALTGLGEARIDDVTVRVLERGTSGGVPASVVSATPQAGTETAFPAPSELLRPPVSLPAVPVLPAAPKAAVVDAAGSPPPATAVGPTPPAQWPGMNLGWPRMLPFGQSPNTPPPGPGGGRVDPFKRARAAQ
jgi:hypothetical protein